MVTSLEIIMTLPALLTVLRLAGSPEEIVVLESLFGISGLEMLDIKHHQAGDVQDPAKKMLVQ
jgi:hypothetical protein